MRQGTLISIVIPNKLILWTFAEMEGGNALPEMGDRNMAAGNSPRKPLWRQAVKKTGGLLGIFLDKF